MLIAGVATYALEIVEDLPDVEVIIVPVGGGSGACGACIVAKAMDPDIQVIGVQAERAPAAYLSWREGVVVEAPMETAAEGLATRSGYELAQAILRDLLDDFVLVSEDEMNEAIVLHLEKTTQPDGARGSGVPGGRPEDTGAAGGEEGGAGRQRREHLPGPSASCPGPWAAG